MKSYLEYKCQNDDNSSTTASPEDQCSYLNTTHRLACEWEQDAGPGNAAPAAQGNEKNTTTTTTTTTAVPTVFKASEEELKTSVEQDFDNQFVTAFTRIKEDVRSSSGHRLEDSIRSCTFMGKECFKRYYSTENIFRITIYHS